MGRKLAPKAKEYARKDGTTSWKVRLRVNGRETSETFETEAAANVFIAQVMDPAIGPARAVELRSRVDASSDLYIPTLAEALDRHLDELSGVDARTPREYMAMAKRTWLPILGPIPVNHINKADIARWVKREDGKIARKSIQNAHGLLSGVLASSVQRGEIDSNPAYKTRLPRTGEDEQGENRYLTHAEFDRLYQCIPPHYQPMVNLMFGTGLRFSEVTALQVRDIDLDARTLRVVRAWKDRPQRLGVPKSMASRRTVALPAVTIDAIRPLLNRGGESFVFTTATGVTVRHNNFWNRIWRPATVRASICDEHWLQGCKCDTPKPWLCKLHEERDEEGSQILARPCGCVGMVSPRPRIHDARHTHASWLIAQGIRLEVIRDRLGHDDIQTTIRVYSHLMPDVRNEAGLAAQAAFASTVLGELGA